RARRGRVPVGRRQVGATGPEDHQVLHGLARQQDHRYRSLTARAGRRCPGAGTPRGPRRRRPMGQFLSALLSGLSTGVPLFLIASGLTLIFGVMGILNFAHGGFFMLGAFVAVSAAGWFGGGSGGWTLFGAVVVAAVAIAAVAVVCDLVVFRRLQKREEIIGLLGTFALLLLLVGVAEQVWGVTPRSLTM